MKRFPISADTERSLPAFLAFLVECRAEAASDGCPRLVSVSLESDHLDPLAVLESIYEPDALHFYVEQPARRIALAGAEEVIGRTFEGPDRFERARTFIRRTFEHTIATGDLDVPFSGPRFFCSFGFFDDSDDNATFPPATVFVPRWQVMRLGDRFCVVANCLVEADSDLAALAQRIWRAHTKFRSFDYSSLSGVVRGEMENGGPSGEGSETDSVEVGSPNHFKESVSLALGEIASGELTKVVLARAVDVTSARDLHPMAALNRLRERYPDCYAFSMGNGRGQSFIGASPERLVRVTGRTIETDALAGSTKRGESAMKDAILVRQLLNNAKDVREHRLVLDSIVRTLENLGAVVRRSERISVLQLSNVQHLHTPVEAELPDGIDVLRLVEELHPTPAVGGTPREAACRRIRELEPFGRGLYAAPLGWIDADGDGEFLVGIRSALIDGSKARVYAGNGIVDGSDVEHEYAETELKLRALFDNLFG
jgi:menaquinone-specific isochorismate synthase